MKSRGSHTVRDLQVLTDNRRTTLNLTYHFNRSLRNSVSTRFGVTAVRWEGKRDNVMAMRSGSLHTRFRNIPLASKHST